MNAQKSWLGVWAATTLIAACATTPNSKTAAQDPSCLHDTGSRIADPNEKCRGYGRSFTHEQLDETGATTSGEALRLLDPSIQVGH